jgi:hypothetical protein
MLTKKFVWFLLPFIALVAVGCTSTTHPNVLPSGSQTIWPLAIGNRWVFRATVFDSSGNQRSTWIDTLKIVSDTLFGSDRWYVQVGFGGKGKFFLQNRANGLWGDGLEYEYPATRNDTYRLGDSTKIIVISADSLITVPAGTFHTVVYQFPGPPLTYEYFSPGVGPVRMEFGPTSSRSETMELLQAILK